MRPSRTGEQQLSSVRPGRAGIRPLQGADVAVVARREVAAASTRRRRHAARGLPDRSGPRRPTSSTTSRPSTASSSMPDPPAEEETAALVRHAEAARRLAEPLLAKVKSAARAPVSRDRAAAHGASSRAMEDAGVRIDTYRMGEITARLADRVEELEARRTSSRARSSCSARRSRWPDPLREARAHAGPQGQDRLLDRHEGAPRDPRTTTRSFP